MGPGQAGRSTALAPQHSPKPWSLPLATDLSAVTLQSWHSQMQRLPDQWRKGIGGSYSTNEGAPNLTTGSTRQAQAILQRVHHHDLLDTILLHGQDRVEELMRIGKRILETGAAIEDPRKFNFTEGVLLNDGSRVAFRPETLDPMAHSLRVLRLRTELWMREFPHAALRNTTGPDSQKAIDAAASRGLSREHSRLFEAAIALASQPESAQRKLLELSPPIPCKPYAEAVDPDFERGYRQVEFSSWRLRKSLEPNGERHRSAKIEKVSEVSTADKVLIHRLVRFRLDALRRAGPEIFDAQRQFGEEAQAIERRPLQENQLFGGPLKGLPVHGSFAHLPSPILERLAQADHAGWLHASSFVDSLGINELRQPRGSQRGDDAHQPYSDAPQSITNRVKLNVLSRAITLSQPENSAASRYLERSVLTV